MNSPPPAGGCEVESTGLVPGDLINLKLGNIVPADSLLKEGKPLEVDQAALTGESLPATKHPGERVLMGSVIVRGELEALVLHTGKNTFFGRAAGMVSKASEEQQGRFAKVMFQNTMVLFSLSCVCCTVIFYKVTRDQRSERTNHPECEPPARQRHNRRRCHCHDHARLTRDGAPPRPRPQPRPRTEFAGLGTGRPRGQSPVLALAASCWRVRVVVRRAPPNAPLSLAPLLSFATRAPRGNRCTSRGSMCSRRSRPSSSSSSRASLSRCRYRGTGGEMEKKTTTAMRETRNATQIVVRPRTRTTAACDVQRATRDAS